MVKIGPPSPKVNTLDVNPNITYADTSVETWWIIEFFLKELRPVEIADLEPEDRNCSICSEGYKIDFHCAVRLPCNHCFGESCITKWLTPIDPWSKVGRVFAPFYLGVNSCPMCRQVLFPWHPFIDTLPQIEMRIKVWDWAYADAGIALSEREYQAREGLLRYIDGCSAHGLDEYYPSEVVRPESEWQADEYHARTRFCTVVSNLGGRRDLTPIQRQLTRRLERISERLKLSDERLRRWHPINQGTQYKDDSENEEECESHEEAEVEEETEELIEGDTEDMRFFRAMFR